MSVEAPVLPCQGCGAPLGVDPTSREGRCPRCGAVTPVPQALRDRAREYQRLLKVERGRVEHARGFGKDAFGDAGKYFGPPLGVLIAGLTISMMVLDEDLQPVAMGVFMLGLLLLGGAFFLWLRFAMRAEEKAMSAPESAQAAAAPPAPVFAGAAGGTCSTCGGPVTFAVEQQSTRCTACGATVYATAAAQQALLGMAGEHADLEMARASRSIVRSLAGGAASEGVAQAFSWLRYLPFLLFPVIIVVIGGSFAFSAGLPDPTALQSLQIVGLCMVGGGLLFAGVFVLVLWLIRRASGGNTLRAAIDTVAATSQGRVATGVGPLLDWLDAYWAAPVPHEMLNVGNSDQGTPITRYTVTFAYAGRPALLVVANAPHLRRTDLLFASYRRRSPDAGTRLPQADEVRRSGFEVLASPGGVHLTRPDADPRAIAPQTVSWLLERAAPIAQA